MITESPLDILERDQKDHYCLPLMEGAHALHARYLLTKESKKSIDIMSFSWKADWAGLLLIKETIAAAQRGVKVRILLDAWPLFGSHTHLKNLLLRSQSANLVVKVFNPMTQPVEYLGGLKLPANLSLKTFHRRLHGKIFVADKDVVIVGGRNISDEYYGTHHKRNFIDAELVYTGPESSSVCKTFESFWNNDLSIPLSEFPETEAEQWEETPQSRPDTPEKVHRELAEIWKKDQIKIYKPGKIQFVADTPEIDVKDPDTTGNFLLEKLGAVREKLRALSSYFIIPEQTVEHFRNLGDKLVVVTNSLQTADNLFTYAASVQQRELAIKEFGATIHEVRPATDDIKQELLELIPQLRGKSPSGFGENEFESQELHSTIHGKIYAFDTEKCIIGSMHIDPRALFLNCEVLFFLEDKDLTQLIIEKIDRLRTSKNARVLAPVPGKTSDISKPFTTTVECYSPRDENDHSIPDKDSSDFYEKFKSDGVFPEIESTEEKIRLLLTERYSNLIKPIL